MPLKQKPKIPSKGSQTRPRNCGPRNSPSESVHDMAEWADEEFMELFMNFCYGGLYDRDVLPQKTRELCAVAACVMANAHPQLRTHIQAAWNCGATKRQIMEVIIQMAIYCGMPYMLQAARIAANEVFPLLKRGEKAAAPPPGLKLKEE